MKRVLVSALAAFAFCTLASATEQLRLWYRQPADQWTDALPVGNGRLGAMVFGGVAEERLQLNEDTVYAGGPHNNNMPTAREAMPEIRRLIFAGEHQAAHNLATEKVMPGKTRPNGMPYQTVGDLKLKF